MAASIYLLASIEIAKALKSPSIAEALDKADVVVANIPEQFATHIRDEVAKAGKITRAANIKAD